MSAARTVTLQVVGMVVGFFVIQQLFARQSAAGAANEDPTAFSNRARPAHINGGRWRVVNEDTPWANT